MAKICDALRIRKAEISRPLSRPVEVALLGVFFTSYVPVERGKRPTTVVRSDSGFTVTMPSLTDY